MKQAIILDTDIGTNPDDFFSLLMLLNSSDVELKLVITGNGFPMERAIMAKRIIDLTGKDIKVVAGEEKGCVDFFGQKFIENSNYKIDKNYLEEIKKVLENNENVTYVCIQGHSNLSSFLKKFPEYKKRMMVMHMGATLRDADKEFISGGTNMEADLLSAKYIYELNCDLKVVGAHTTINDAIRITPETKIYRKLKESKLPIHKMLFEHLLEYNKRRKIWPAMHDPLTVSVSLGKNFVKFEKVSICFNKEGRYKIGRGNNILISKKEFDSDGFMRMLYFLLF